MSYEYQQRASAQAGENVAEIYVVRSSVPEARREASRELLAAVERLPASAQDILRALVKVGFQAMVRK